MLKLGLHLLLGAASSACGLAAIGLVLYGHGSSALAAAQLFAGTGFVAGLFGGGLHQWMNQRQRQYLHSAAMSPEALAGLVRATVAGMTASRTIAARPASAPAAVSPIPAASAASAAAAAAATNAATAVSPRQFASSAYGV